MTGTRLPDDDESRAINAESVDANPSVISALMVGMSLLGVVVLAGVAILVVLGQGDSGSDEGQEELVSVIDPEVSTQQPQGDQVQVSIGPAGHQVGVACFLPANSSPPLVVFVSSAPINLDLRAETTLFDDAGSSYSTVARADVLRPGEQRQAVPRTLSDTKVVVERSVTGCRIDSIQADRQIVRFE